MLFMVLGIVRAQQQRVQWLLPYFPMLRSWADELVRTTEFPADQICTDDFTGKLANNTNLGAKGIIALETFAELCRIVQSEVGAAGAAAVRATDCAHYTSVASAYAKTWMSYAHTTDGASPHYKMSFNDLKGIDDSWSIKCVAI